MKTFEEKVQEIAIAVYYAFPIFTDCERVEYLRYEELDWKFQERLLAEARVALGCIMKRAPLSPRSDGGWTLRWSNLLEQWRTDNALPEKDPWQADLPQPPDDEAMR